MKKEEYQQALRFLLTNFQGTEKIHNPAVIGILAFSAAQLGKKKQEHQWIKEYFETYRGSTRIFSFLDRTQFLKIVAYLSSWEKSYPLVHQIMLINGEKYQGPQPPTELLLGIDIKNRAYYKLVEKGEVIKGSVLSPGFNTVPLPARDLFAQSGSHIYVLFLKKGSLVLKKKLTLQIQLSSSEPQKEEPSGLKGEYTLSLHIGENLILSRKKVLDRLQMEVNPTPLPPGYSFFDPDPDENPMANSVSIFDAAGVLTQLVKEATTKKKKEAEPYTPQTTRRLTASFMRTDPQGKNRKVQAVIILKTQDL
ncbi:hypothetical protein KGY73_09825 [bacterium]|nr:hypothetical protein [bacterium]